MHFVDLYIVLCLTTAAAIFVALVCVPIRDERRRRAVARELADVARHGSCYADPARPVQSRRSSDGAELRRTDAPPVLAVRVGEFWMVRVSRRD